MNEPLCAHPVFSWCELHDGATAKVCRECGEIFDPFYTLKS